MISVDGGMVTTGVSVVQHGPARAVTLAQLAVDHWPAGAKRQGLRCRTAGPLLAGVPAEFAVGSTLEAVRFVADHCAADLKGAVCAVEGVLWYNSDSAASGAGRGQMFVDLVANCARMAERLTIATGRECIRPSANDWRKGVFGLPSSLKGKQADDAVRAYVERMGLGPLVASRTKTDAKGAAHIFDAVGVGLYAAKKTDPKVRITFPRATGRPASEAGVRAVPA